MNDPPKAAGNIVWHHATVTRSRREKMNGHGSVILWLRVSPVPANRP